MAAEDAGLVIDGQRVPVRFCPNARARRISLRIDERDGSLVIVLPPGSPAGVGLAFAHAQGAWVRERLERLPARVPFVDGAIVPVLGVSYRVRNEPLARRGVWAEDGIVHVSGNEAFLGRRLGDWLRRRAREELATRALPMAARAGRRIARIVVGDPRTRWGSCTSRGRLAFSWRLVLAPPEALSYVVAHEVAHLVEMNHSPAFWRVVEALEPGAKRWRAWLKDHGPELRRYG